MKNLVVILYIVFQINYCFSQTISTVITDSIKIILKGDTLVYDKYQNIHFLNNLSDTTVCLFNNSIVKVNKRFLSGKKKKIKTYNINNDFKGKIKYGYLYSSNCYFYLNDYPLDNRCVGTLGEDLQINSEIWSNWDKISYSSDSAIYIEIKYFLLNACPIDTSNYTGYKLNGNWVRGYFSHFKITNYENNHKNGKETIFQKNGLRIETIYKNGSEIGNRLFDKKGRQIKELPLHTINSGGFISFPRK